MNKLQCPVVEKVQAGKLSEQMEEALCRVAEVYRMTFNLSLEEALVRLASNPDYSQESRKYFAKLAAQAKF